MKTVFGFSMTMVSDLKCPQVSIARKTISRKSRHSPNAPQRMSPADLRAKSAGIEPSFLLGAPISQAAGVALGSEALRKIWLSFYGAVPYRLN